MLIPVGGECMYTFITQAKGWNPDVLNGSGIRSSGSSRHIPCTRPPATHIYETAVRTGGWPWIRSGPGRARLRGYCGPVGQGRRPNVGDRASAA